MPLPLFPYQEQGAQFLAARERAGLFDEMGVGKTAQAVRAADLRQAGRGVVVAPAAVRQAWLGEFAKFQRIPRRCIKGITIHDAQAWAAGHFDVLVTSYDMLAKWAKHFDERAETVQFMVIDEGQYLKDEETRRAKAIIGTSANGSRGVATWAEQAWWLTGTPVPNDPADIFTFLRFARVMPLKRRQFVDRYFLTHQRTYSTAARVKHETLSELRTLIGNNALRRTLVQTGVELPPIWTTTSEIEGDTAAVRDLLASHPGMDNAILEAIREGGLSKLDAEWIATLRRLIGEAKALPYAARLVGELQSGMDKIVVFGIHRQALTLLRDYLWQAGYQTAVVTGATPERERVRAVERFQTDPACRIFIGNIRAAGTGLTLTAACHLDILESDWTPAGNAQALKRVHRLSQTRNVRARFISLANSFDETVTEIVADKTKEISLIESY